MLSLSETAIQAAVTTLLERRLSGKPGDNLPENQRPQTLDDALAMQAAFAHAWCERNDDSIGGWKCLVPSPGKLVLAPIFTSTINTYAPVTAEATAGKILIEPELGFYLAHDLPTRETPYTSEAVDAAIARTHLALELIHCRHADKQSMNFVDSLADNLVNQGLFIGPEVNTETAANKTQIHFTATTRTDTVFDGAGQHPNGNPRAPLYWLAEFLRERGEGLIAGQVVITGSWAGVWEAPTDTPITIDYAGLGNFEVIFHARQQQA